MMPSLGRAALVLGALTFSLPATGFDDQSRPARQATYNGILAGPAFANAERITVHVESPSTAEEIGALAEVLEAGGQQGLLAAVRETDTDGWVQLGTQLRSPLAIVQSMATEKGRRVIALADRTIRFWEIWRVSRSLDYPFAAIVLDLDERGRGEGHLLPAARAIMLRNGTLVLENFQVQPMRILSVSRADR